MTQLINFKIKNDRNQIGFQPLEIEAWFYFIWGDVLLFEV